MSRLIYYLLLLFLAILFNSATSAFAELKDYPYIVGSVNVPGFVTELVSVKSRPNLLFAMVQPDGKPKADEKYGVYIFDIKELLSPRQICYFSVPDIRKISLTPDGKTIFIEKPWFSGKDEKEKKGIKILDVSQPDKPLEVADIDVHSSVMHLSRNGKLLFIQEWDEDLSKGKFIKMYDVSNPRDPAFLTNIQIEYYTYGMVTTDNDRLLIIRDSAKQIIVYNIENQSTPTLISKGRFFADGYNMISSSKGIIYSVGNSDFSIIDERSLQGIGTFNAGSFHAVFISDNESVAIIPEINKNIRVLDISNPRVPLEIARYPVPNYPGSAAQIKTGGLIYVGMIGSLIMINPASLQPTADALVSAHKTVLAEYKEYDNKPNYSLAEKAIRILDTAGIKLAIKEKPQGLSDKLYAQILNDYAFFKMQLYNGQEEASQLLRKIINLDSSRAVAYLNIADTLRKLLSTAKDYKRKVSMTKEVKGFYAKYKKLTGRSTPDIDKFMKRNIVDFPPKDVCSYIASYINEGRTRELFGGGEFIDINSDGIEERIEFQTGGTMHITNMELFNKSTGEPISVDEADKDFAYNIAIVPLFGEYYLLYYNDDKYPVVATNISKNFEERVACRFDVNLKETVSKKSADKNLCQMLINDREFEYLEFNESHSLKPSEKYSESSAKNALTFDFDNDGKKESVIEIEYSSGAGRGCGYTYFDFLNKEKNKISDDEKRGLLITLQHIFKKKYRHPVPHCGGNTTGWFKYKGITYYESKYPDEGPKNSDDEFHMVAYIKDGKVNNTCEFEFNPVVSVRKR
jgi:hypothetical protein